MSLEIATVPVIRDGLGPDAPFPADIAPWFAADHRHFLLLDAARLEDLTGEDMVASFAPGLRCKCLFLDEDLYAVAPWLIELVPGDPDSDDVLLAFLTDLFGKRAGLLLRSAAPYDRVFSHLRTFVKVRHERREADLFFRFWDPLVAGTYFPGIAARPERIARLLRTAEGVAVDLLVEGDEEDTALMLTPTGDAPAGMARAPVVLDSADAALFNEVAFKALVLQLADWMQGAFADGVGDLPAARRKAAARHVVDTGRAFGFRLKDEFSYLAHVMAYFGGWFFEGGGVPQLTRIVTDADDPARHRTLEAAFGDAWDASPRGTLLRHWDAVQARIAALKPEDRMTPDALKALFKDHLSENTAVSKAVAEAALPAARAAGFSVAEEGRHIFLSLVLGHRYQEDPFRPWAGLPLQDVMAMAWAQTVPESVVQGGDT